MKKILTEIDLLQEEINKHRPLDIKQRNHIKEYYRIGLTYTSNALEGNSLTETETKIVIEEGITIGGKRVLEHLEALGHSEAFDCMYQKANGQAITEEDIKLLHKLFYFRINNCDAGVYRNVRAYITGSKYPLPSPHDLEHLMAAFIKRLITLKSQLHPVELAAFAHKEFVFIHPFVDGNGRVARLLMNLILLQAGFTIAIIPPILRAHYIQALEKAHTNEQEFMHFIAQVVKETQKDYIRLFEEPGQRF